MRALLDTSVLISDDAPVDVDAAISVVSLTGTSVCSRPATTPSGRAEPIGSLPSKPAFDPLPVTTEVARAWGRLAAAVSQRGGKPRRRQIDLAIAATASVEGVPLLTHNAADFRIINDLVDVRRP